MFIVTKDGKKLRVDDSELDCDETPFKQEVALYTDDTILKPVWYLNLYHSKKATFNSFFRREKEQLELVAEVYFEHKPTQEEILYQMAAHGLNRFDFASVEKGFELDMR